MPVPSFSVGEVLTAANMNAIGLWLVKTHTFTNQTSTDVLSAFPSDYQAFRVVAELRANAGSSTYGAFRLLAGTTESATNYASKSLWSPMTGASRTFDDADVRTNQFSVGPIGSSTVDTIAVFDFINPNLARPTSMTGSGVGYYSANPWSWITSGVNTNTTAYDGFRFIPTAAATGVFYVYGYRD